MLGSRDFGNRDDMLIAEVLKGNIPEFMKNMVPVEIADGAYKLTYYVTPDYVSIGDNQDYIRVPVGGAGAQRIADAFGCILPTPKMSDQIWQAAKVKLNPKPMSGMTSTISGQTYSPQQFLAKKMTDTDSFVEHNNIIQDQLQKSNHNVGDLVAGSKKDIVISNDVGSGKLGIHGLHTSKGKAIQSGPTSHTADYRDYSHAVRLVDRFGILNGKRVDLINDVLKNPEYASLISNDGVLKMTSYDSKSIGAKKNEQMVASNTVDTIDMLNKYLESIKI